MAGGEAVAGLEAPDLEPAARALLGWHYLSNATCLRRPQLFSGAWLVEYGYLKLLHYSPLLKKTCIRQVVLDKWFLLTCPGDVFYNIWWYNVWVYHNMIWYDIWYDIIWYDMIWYDTAWSDLIWYDTAWYDMIWYDMIWYDMIWYGMVWYDMIWYDTTSGSPWSPPAAAARPRPGGPATATGRPNT